MREHLKNRENQPGSNRTFERSEKLVTKVIKRVVDRYPQITTTNKSRLNIFPKYSGGCIMPENTIENVENGKVMNIEVKKQGDRGNAEERVYKLFTPKFSKVMKEFFGVDYHPFKAIFCESLATNERYTGKFDVFLDDEDYFLWDDYENEGQLEDYIEKVIKDYLL
jgi:hypothetical protein